VRDRGSNAGAWMTLAIPLGLLAVVLVCAWRTRGGREVVAAPSTDPIRRPCEGGLLQPAGERTIGLAEATEGSRTGAANGSGRERC